LHSDKQIREALSLPVLAEVPLVLSAQDEHSQRRRAVLGWVAATLIVTTILAGSAFSYLHA
jgi:hypothetical protein